MTRSIVLHTDDTVATLIADGPSGAACRLQGARSGEVRLAGALPFGHKVAIRAMDAGADVIKYGQVIGRTTAAIAVGEHVHVHNVESRRGRGDLAAAAKETA